MCCERHVKTGSRMCDGWRRQLGRASLTALEMDCRLLGASAARIERGRTELDLPGVIMIVKIIQVPNEKELNASADVHSIVTVILQLPLIRPPPHFFHYECLHVM